MVKVIRVVLFILVFSLGHFGLAQATVETLGNLPSDFNETSGLIYHNGRLVTHNDSGDEARLLEFDPVTLELTRTVTITNQENVDWEDIAQDDTHIYIGDFGNNSGDRQDLTILKVSKAAYEASDTVEAERIAFNYEDQTDFTRTENSDFDAEALFVFNDQLIVLTKQWQQMGTVAYRLPKEAGSFVATRFDAYQINGLVTGATYDPMANELYLVGYSATLFPLFTRVSGVTDMELFGGEITTTGLTIGRAQVEAITQANGQFYISSEAVSIPPLINNPAQLFTFLLDEVPDDTDDDTDDDADDDADDDTMDMDGADDVEPPTIPAETLIVFKAFGSNTLSYRLNTDKAVLGMGIFDTTGRVVNYVPLEFLGDGPIDISYLPKAMYYLVFELTDGVISAPFLR